MPSHPPRNFAQPQWDGSICEPGTQLLLHAEQGIGDTIQFIRYLSLTMSRCPAVIVECQPELQRLLRFNAPGCRVIARGETLPPFDMHCPLLSLPRVFKTRLDSIPAHLSYLFPEPHLLEGWRKRFAGVKGRKIGLVWAGNRHFKGDRTRSLSLDRLQPIGAVSGICSYSLQKGYASAQIRCPSAKFQLEDLSSQLHDFAETAAAMCALDLIITTDTSVAHLAAALGRPTWLMLQFVPDWRWMLIRDDSPWYPTMRLFRQPSRGDWDSVIRGVADELRNDALRTEK
jgi:hypothetical protein